MRFTFLTALLLAGSVSFGAVPQLLIDTDMLTDCDDVAALELAFACERRGETRVLAVTVSSAYPKSVPVVEAVNAFCGRADVPVGAPKNGTGHRRDDSCFLDKVSAEFPHEHASNDDAPDAVAVMRRTLAAAEDGSVTLVTLGYLSNVASLLRSGPDAISPLDGRTLLAQKVKEWACMGGNFPNDPAKDNVNFTRDAPAAVFALTNYPGRITFVGREIGHNIFIGDRFHELPAANPLRRAYELHRGRFGTNWDHHTADPTTILYAVYGAGERFGRVEGTLHLQPNCAFTWDPSVPSNMSYLTQREQRTATALTMERLLMPEAPSRRPPDLRVSANRRFLETTDGQPFFYLADTAWELFHRLDRNEARRYLDNRMARGFTVIQCVALAEEDGLETPGAAQMQHAKNLLLRYPYFTRIPAPEMIVPDPQGEAIVPGAGTRRFVATRDAEGTYAFVYAPVGIPFTLDLSMLAGESLRYAWMNPRDGTQSDWKPVRRGSRVRFLSPTPGELTDWVLVIESGS